MFMWQLLTTVWVRYTVSSVTWIVRKTIILVHSSFYIKRSSDLCMLTLQIFIITWTPTLRESRRLGGLNLGKDYGDCALASHLKVGGRTWKDLIRTQFRRLTLHDVEELRKRIGFLLNYVLSSTNGMAAEDLVTSAWSQSQTKNASFLTGVFRSRLES